MKDRPLTPKQKRFVEEYIKDFNGTQAVIRAGYSKRGADVTAVRLLGNPRVVPLLLEKQKQLAEECHVEAKEVIEEIKKLAFANMQDYINIDGHGNPVIDLSAMTRDQAAALSEVTNRRTKHKFGSNEHYGIKFHSKDSALEKLCKHLGLYKDPEVDAKIELKIVMYGESDGD